MSLSSKKNIFPVCAYETNSDADYMIERTNVLSVKSSKRSYTKLAIHKVSKSKCGLDDNVDRFCIQLCSGDHFLTWVIISSFTQLKIILIIYRRH